MKQSSPDSKHSSHSPKKSRPKHLSSDDSDDSLSSQPLHIKHSQQNKHSRHPRSKRSRSRQKTRNRGSPLIQNQIEKSQNQLSSSKDHLDLALYGKLILYQEHFYFLENENSVVTAETAIWSSVINFGLRPKKILIICQSEKKILRLLKSSNIKRQIIVIDQDSKEQFFHNERDVKELAQTYDVVLMTQQKSSITLGLNQDDIELFDLVVNYGKTYSIEFYSLLPQFLGKHGIIFTVFEDSKEMERHERKLKIRFKNFNGKIHQNDIQKQIFNEIQFSKSFNKLNAFDDLSLLKTLPYSMEETALRLFSLLKQAYKPSISLHQKRQGYVTFCLKTDTEFNSIKYIWNFIRQEMAPGVIKNIKDMKKFQNERGVLFNVPITDLGKWQNLQSKITKNQKKYKGYKLYEFIHRQLPKLQDTESEQYKKLQMRKDQAMKNRHKWELFIGGIPYESTEVDIRKYFSEKGVNLFTIRILRDSSGFSKGIAFGLAENEENFERGIKLNGQMMGDRQLRIKLADQKKSD